MKKILYVLLIFSLILFPSACKKQSNDSCDPGFLLENGYCIEINPDDEEIESIISIDGINDQNVIVDHYFDPLENVKIMTNKNRNVAHLLDISGHVNYGVIGTYQLTYTLDFNDTSIDETRVITIIDGIYEAPTGSRTTSDANVETLGFGSYYNGTLTSYDHPLNPAFIEADLLDMAIPSSGWWTSLLVANYGGSNGIYTNPLRMSYTNEGMDITNPNYRFVKYWNINQTPTIAQFPLALKDSFLKSSDLDLSYQTKVIGYSDASVKVAMRNIGDTKDHMVTTLTQGSPYVFVEVANQQSLTYTFDTNGLDNYEYYDLNGNLITTTSHTSQAIIVKLVKRHSGYDTSPPEIVGQPTFSDKYYLINAPENTVFTITSNNHPFGLNNRLHINLGDSNILSIAAINDLSEGSFYHQHGYTMTHDTDISYDIDDQESKVVTQYHYQQTHFNEQYDNSLLLALMPHHYKYADVNVTTYTYRTVRGTLKLLDNQQFQTELSFHGVIPGFTLPENDLFSSDTLISYLEGLNQDIDLLDEDDFINAEGPYWNSKAIYPLSQAIIISDQLGQAALKSDFIDKLKYVIEDWYTYSGSQDEKFLFYNATWGTNYYSNNDFGTASELSDHSFTHGYIIYASSILAMYDPTFLDNYKDMVDFLLDDYMYPYKDQEQFQYLRNFDPWAGHSWAHGYGTFAEGNNLESTSEALNSWNAGYQWALATNDKDRKEAAIYGFVTELSAIKEYWFDYDDTNWDPDYGDYVDVAGMVWGGKHDYATWFGANPTFIYGMQWLPSGEYLTSYALDQQEHSKLSSIFETYLDAKNQTIDTWYSNMWFIQSITDSKTAISNFDSAKILNDDYPNELALSYYMIHAIDTLNQRHSNTWMAIEDQVSASLYEDALGNIYAMVWNASNDVEFIEFYDDSGLIYATSIEANAFIKILIN